MAGNKWRPIGGLLHKHVTNMDRDQLNAYLAKVYAQGFEDGRKAATPDVLLRAIREALLATDDIGPKRADAIMQKFGETFTATLPEEPAESTEDATT